MALTEQDLHYFVSSSYIIWNPTQNMDCPSRHPGTGNDAAKEAAPVLMEEIPLCVDLDGTLIATDLLWETLLLLLKRNPAYVFLLPWWLAAGRPHLKRQIALRVEIDAARLPYHPELLAHLGAARENGVPLLLVTASDSRLAYLVAQHLGIFSEVLCTQPGLNLSGTNKANVLVARFGKRGFDYAGNSSVDLAVWRHCREAIVVAAPGSRLKSRAEKLTRVAIYFPAKPGGPRHDLFRCAALLFATWNKRAKHRS